MKITLFLISLILFSACSININLNDPNKTSTQKPEKKTPLEMKEPVPTIATIQTPIPSPKVSIDDQITEFFANKFDKNPTDVNLTISKNTGMFASGGISFGDEMGGGMWLAYKDAFGDWQVVFDGNGTIPCESVEPYNFPTTMVPECWDEVSQDIKKL